MGGNVKSLGVEVSPWSLKTPDDRENLVSDISWFLHTLEDVYTEKTDEFLDYTFVGSARNLMLDKISSEDFIRYKPKVGDVDILLDLKYKADVLAILDSVNQIDKFKIIGIKNHGLESSVIVKDTTTKLNHQIDFVFSKTEILKDAEFLRSSNWEDIKLGIKGVHHKWLLNAIGLDEYKFSIAYGLSSRDKEVWYSNPTIIHYALFGSSRGTSGIYSFQGLVKDIILFKDKETQNKIFNKFADSCKQKPCMDSEKALLYFARHLRYGTEVTSQFYE